MKIMYVGNSQGINNVDKYYLTETRLTNGFIRLGHNVCVFNDRDQSRYLSFMRSQASGKFKMNQRLLECCDSFKPDLLMLSNCKNVTNETLNKIRENLPNIKISYTNVDPLSLDKNLNYLNERASIVDTIFITSAGGALKQFNQGRTKTYFFPNPVDHAIDIEQAFNNKQANIDLLFLGRAFRHGYDEREVYANHLSINLSDNIRKYIGGLGVNDKEVYGDDYLKLLGQSRMGICMNKTRDFYLYASDRMSHYMAAGVMIFLQDGPDFESILGDDSFVSFTDEHDLTKKIEYYHTRPDDIRRIAQNGHKAVHDLFNVDNVCQFILDITFTGTPSQDHIWHIQDVKKQQEQ